jgi:hypothetical protein
MLSLPTLSFLAELQGKSHTAYPEGGLLYTYVEASNQAHSRYPASDTASSKLSPTEFKELGRFLQAAQGDYLSKTVAPIFEMAAQRLMEHLREDVRFDEVSCVLEDCGHDMEAKVKMARRSDNCFIELELWWSID